MKDPCIRRLLKETELSKYLNDDSSKVVEEMNIPAAKARIDMAVINGHLHGYEIKSAADTLQRLPNQIEAYTKIFDFLSIVTEGKYFERILTCTPSWVGVYVCSSKNGVQKIDQVRAPAINTDQEGFFLAKLLWRDEILQILIQHKIKHRKKDRNWILCELLAANIKTPELSAIVRSKLKERQNWKSDITEGCAIM
jgi:hypothetical protein